MSLRAATFRRLVAACLLGLAFVVMASVFSPDRSKAEDGSARAVNVERQFQTADAHAGLHSLGAIETATAIVQIYGTTSGPRYSIYDRNTRRELGTLLSLEQVNQRFPELRLTDADFSAFEGEFNGGPLMLAEPIEGLAD